MSFSKNLKLLNYPVVTVFVLWCMALVVVFVFSTYITWTEIVGVFENLRPKDGIMIALMPIITLILNGLLSHRAKAVLVYWRLRNPLPGCRAFTKHAVIDERIDTVKLAKKLNKTPTDPSEQNALWFELSKKYADRPVVFNSHKIYLLSRDLTVVSFLFLIIGCTTAVLKHGSIMAVAPICSILLVQYLLLSISARNYGNRFVCNVIAEFVTDEP